MNRIEQAKSNFKKFASLPFREYQAEAVEFAIKSEKQVIVISAGTGFGKSLSNACLCDIYADSTYLVHSKALQDQIQGDFSEFVVLKGRSNYKCNLHWNEYNPIMSDSCPFAIPSSCPSYSQCTYRMMKFKALKSQYRVLNYKYFLTEANYVGKFSTGGVLIADEADTLEGELLSFIKLIVTERMVERYHLTLPKRKTTQAKDGVSSWLKWAELSRVKIKSQIQLLKTAMDRVGQSPPETMLKEFNRATSFLTSLNIFCEHVDEEWLLNISNTKYGERWEFFPTWITSKLIEQYLLRHCSKIILTSATFPALPVLSKTLGIPESMMDYYEVPSTFPPANKPIYLDAVADMSRKTAEEDTPKLLKRIKEILADNINVKGLIHCNSNKIRDIVMQVNNPRLITHNSQNREEVLLKFKESILPLVLVSPSMDRGVSLEYDLCRFIIIAKAPFPHLGDKQVSKRLYSGGLGQKWYSGITAQTIMQMVGRGMRSKDDTCVNYLLDSQIKKLILKNPMLFSNDFRNCVM